MASSISSYKKKVIESLALIPLQLKVLALDTWEYLKVIFTYYKNLSFAKADLQLVLKGLLENPFKVARFYVEKKGGKAEQLSTYTYGETPITVFAEIAKEAKLGPQTTLIECGAGRGRIALFARAVLGCKVIAYEKVPEFAQRLKKLASSFSDFEVREEDYFHAKFEEADAIFLYGTTLTDGEIRSLGKELKKAKVGTLLITVSWYLNETSLTPSFPILKVLKGTFPWGMTNIYIQVKTDDPS